MCRPGTAQHNIVLLVEEVGRVSRIHRHRVEALPWTEDSAGPLPDAAHVTLPGKDVAVSSDWRGVPILESYIGTIEVDKQLLLALSIHLSDSGCRWGRDFDTVI